MQGVTTITWTNLLLRICKANQNKLKMNCFVNPTGILWYHATKEHYLLTQTRPIPDLCLVKLSTNLIYNSEFRKNIFILTDQKWNWFRQDAIIVYQLIGLGEGNEKTLLFSWNVLQRTDPFYKWQEYSPCQANINKGCLSINLMFCLSSSDLA